MKTMQIRNVPDHIHRRIKERAARSGISLSEYLLHELQEISGLPSPAEFTRMMQSREPLEQPLNSATALRKENKKLC